MSGPVRSGGLPQGKSAEEAFRDNLRSTVAGWQQRLRTGPGSAIVASAITEEASELRRIAQSRGWGAIAQQLHGVEGISHHVQGALAQAVAALGYPLAPPNVPQTPRVHGPPPFTLRFDSPR